MITLIIICIINLLLFIFLIYINSKLFVYIKKLEDILNLQITKSENLQQSIKEIVQEGYLLNDGRLKKFLYQKDNNYIYNGVNIQEENIEL